MSFDYSIVLRQEKHRTLTFISVLLCLIAIAFCLLFASSEGWPWIRLLPAIAVSLLLLYNSLARRLHLHHIPYPVHLVLASLVWLFKPGFYWIGVLYLLMAVLEHKSRRTVTVRFSADEVEYDALYKRQFEWKDLTNVVLKDGILTLDFRSNKIIQKDIHEQGLDEAAFNAYCRTMLSGAK